MIGQKMIIEKMAERAMPYIVQQGGPPQQGLDVSAAGHVGENLIETVVKTAGRTAGQMHRTEHVLEASVLRGGD